MAYDFSAMNARLTSTFGETVTHSPASGDDQDLLMIPTDPAQSNEQIPGVFAVLSAPMSAFVTPPARNDGITYRGETYRVFGIPQDIGGMIRIALVKTS